MNTEIHNPESGQPGLEARLGMMGELKLLFAALGAGGNAVPMGDNSRTARLLAEYANSLRTRQ